MRRRHFTFDPEDVRGYCGTDGVIRYYIRNILFAVSKGSLCVLLSNSIMTLHLETRESQAERFPNLNFLFSFHARYVYVYDPTC